MKYLKIAVKALLYFFLILFISLFGFYAFYNEALPSGKQGAEADALAKELLNALNYQAYKELDYIEWKFSRLGKEHSYQWDKKKGHCQVTIDSVSVKLNTVFPYKSEVSVNGKRYKGEKEKEFIDLAEARFNNDSFWLVAPYKLFDAGVERRLVEQQNGQDALMVTYKRGGTTPGDSYLWLLDNNKRPIAFQLWVKILPIGGLKASWEDWSQTSKGAFFPTKHKILALEIKITDLKVR